MTGRQGDEPGLQDDVLTRRSGPPSPRAWLRDAADRLVGADPGLGQLRTALQAVLGIGVGLGLAYLFVQLTGALQLPAGAAPAPELSAENHVLLLVMMLLAGIVPMLATFVVQERSVMTQVLSSLFLPIPMATALVLGLLVGPYRVPSLAYMVVAMAVAVYLRRFGQRGLGAGMAVFFGAFFGSFLHSEIRLVDVGWIAADLWVGVLASLLVRLAFFRPDPEQTLARMRRSQRARARRLIVLGARVLAEDDQRAVAALQERINRQLVRLNETTLMIDAQLVATDPRTAAVHAQRSFDAELALSNAARYALALAGMGTPRPVRRRAAAALTALIEGDPATMSRATAALRAVVGADRVTTVLVSRLADSVEHYALARRRLGGPVGEEEIAAAGEFTASVQLVNGWLPGSTPVSTAASTTPGRALPDRSTMPPYLRTTVQIAVAGTIATLAGDAVSGLREYWAVLTVFVCFLFANNSGEQLRRALFRASGTAIGIVLGDLLVHLTGGNVWVSVPIVLVALFFGIYLIRVNYTFMTIGITVTIAQLYVQLGEFGWPVLLLRLAETAVGVAAVILTVVLVLPLRPQRVLTAGLLSWLRALRGLLEAAFNRREGKREPLRPLLRAVDAAYAALVATAMPLRRVAFGRVSSEMTEILAVSAATRQYARSLVASLDDVETAEEEPEADLAQLHAAVEQMRASVEAIEHRLTSGEHGDYVRSSSLVTLALDDLRKRQSPLGNVLEDLTLLDAALARLAAAVGMDIRALDTDRPAETSEDHRVP